MADLFICTGHHLCRRYFCSHKWSHLLEHTSSPWRSCTALDDTCLEPVKMDDGRWLHLYFSCIPWYDGIENTLPNVDWTDHDVQEYLGHNNVEIIPENDFGFLEEIPMEEAGDIIFGGPDHIDLEVPQRRVDRIHVQAPPNWEDIPPEWINENEPVPNPEPGRVFNMEEIDLMIREARRIAEEGGGDNG